MTKDIETRVTDLENRLTAIEKELHTLVIPPPKTKRNEAKALTNFC